MDSGGVTGRAVRIPLGAFLIGLATAGLAIVLAYIGGYQYAEHTLREAYEERLLESDGLFNPGAPSLPDPLQDSAERRADAERGGPASSSGSGEPTREGQEPTGATGSNWGSDWGPMTSDPRVSGLNYLKLLEGNLEPARTVAEFCRSRGLEAYLLIGDNSRFARVIVLPGFEDASGPAATALQERVRAVGQELAVEHPSEGNLANCYFSLYRGPSR